MSFKKCLSRNEKPANLDVWSSILLTQKANDEVSELTAPYIHPTVKKRSKNCFLSEKSLEICTESLGSETGSDGYLSSYEKREDSEENDDKHKYSKKKKSLPRCFPPPLPSLLSGSQHGGPSLHLVRVPHRENGRLFLKAVSIVSYNNFLAKRQDGRLVLTFASDEEDKQEEEEDVDEGVMEEEEPMIVAKTGVFNAYDKCYWLKVVMGKDDSWNIIMKINEEAAASSDESQELLVVRGKKGCKYFRRSFLFWEEPYCSTIATTS